MIQVKLTPSQFAAKVEELEAKEGIDLSSDSGTIKKEGVVANYRYDGTTLSISITRHPMLFSEDYCEKFLARWLDTPPSSQAQANPQVQ